MMMDEEAMMMDEEAMMMDGKAMRIEGITVIEEILVQGEEISQLTATGEEIDLMITGEAEISVVLHQALVTTMTTGTLMVHQVMVMTMETMGTIVVIISILIIVLIVSRVTDLIHIQETLTRVTQNHYRLPKNKIQTEASIFNRLFYIDIFTFLHQKVDFIRIITFTECQAQDSHFQCQNYFICMSKKYPSP